MSGLEINKPFGFSEDMSLGVVEGALNVGVPGKTCVTDSV